MIVPYSKGADSSTPAQQQPSETDMLMALGVMHSQGRFDVAGDVVRGPIPSYGKEWRLREQGAKGLSANPDAASDDKVKVLKPTPEGKD